MKEPQWRQKLQILVVLFSVLGICLAGYNWALMKWALQVWHEDYLRVGYFIQLKNERNWQTEKPVQILVLGDSTVQMAVNPLLLPVSALNLAVDGNSNVASYHFAKDFVAKRGAPKCLVFSNSGDWQSHHRETFDVQTREGIYRFSDLVKIWLDFPSESSGNDFLNRWFYFWPQALLHFFHLDFRDLLRLREGLKRDVTNLNNTIDYIRHHQGYFPLPDYIIKPESKFYQVYHEFMKRPFEASNLEDHYLRKMVNLAEERKIQFYYLFLPVADTEFRTENARFFEERETHIRKILETNPQVRILKPFDVLSRKHFSDFSHMNQSGAPVLMEELKKSLSSCF